MLLLLTGSTFFVGPPAPRLASHLVPARDMLPACIPPFLRRAGWILLMLGCLELAGWMASFRLAASSSLRLFLLCIKALDILYARRSKGASPRQARGRDNNDGHKARSEVKEGAEDEGGGHPLAQGWCGPCHVAQ